MERLNGYVQTALLALLTAFGGWAASTVRNVELAVVRLETVGTEMERRVAQLEAQVR